MFPEPLAQSIAALARWMKSSSHTIFFTGAGMSTESGLPDFRSSDGLWRNNRRFEELASIQALEWHHEEFVAFYRWRIEMMRPYAPHAGHYLVARWQKEGKIQTLITQNVDGFHTRAGSPDPIELHGTLSTCRCQHCGKLEDALQFLEPAGLLCASCGAKMRPGVVLFGEPLPEDALAAAHASSQRAKLFVVLGSSLLVSPANLFPFYAKKAGARLVIINREETPLDNLANLLIRTSIKDALEQLDELLPPA